MKQRGSERLELAVLGTVGRNLAGEGRGNYFVTLCGAMTPDPLFAELVTAPFNAFTGLPDGDDGDAGDPAESGLFIPFPFLFPDGDFIKLQIRDRKPFLSGDSVSLG